MWGLLGKRGYHFINSHVAVSKEFLQCTDKLNSASFCLRACLCNLNNIYNINKVERSKNVNAVYQFGSVSPCKRLSLQHSSLCLTFPQVSDSTPFVCFVCSFKEGYEKANEHMLH